MGIPQREHGIVAILDALGASSYGDEEIERFLNAREIVLALLDDKRDELDLIEAPNLTTFTFNDTIIIVLKCGPVPPTLKLVATFSAVVRKFIVDSMKHGLLFRGSAAIGTLRVDEQSNTVMGEAVTDAAQWYEESNWVGVHFTPRSAMEMQRMLEGEQDEKNWAFVRYAVPLRAGDSLETFAVNWPKIFLVPRLRPWSDNIAPRAKLLRFLSRHRVPKGTELKYSNTVKFFDYAVSQAGGSAKMRPKKK